LLYCWLSVGREKNTYAVDPTAKVSQFPHHGSRAECTIAYPKISGFQFVLSTTNKHKKKVATVKEDNKLNAFFWTSRGCDE